MQIITSVYQSNDGHIFQGVRAHDECRQYEIAMNLRHIKTRLNEIGYEETDVAEPYNEIFPRRHGGRLYHAKPRNEDEYKGFLDYVYFTAGEPSELTEARKMNPIFPMDLSVVVHRGTKRPHATILQAEIAAGLRNGTMQPVEMVPLQSTALVPVMATVETKTHRAAEPRRITWNGVTKTVREWADELGITPRTLYSRLKKFSLEDAMTKTGGELQWLSRRKKNS